LRWHNNCDPNVCKKAHWQGAPTQGVYIYVTEIGDAENVSKNCVSRFVRLAPLAPGLVGSILQGRPDLALML
jgi:hypothetical protein